MDTLETAKKEGKLKNGHDKKVIYLLKAFKELGEEKAKEDELFQKIKSSYKALNEFEREDLFRIIIEKIEVSEEKVKPLLKKLVSRGDDDMSWSKWLSELRRRAYSPRLDFFRKIFRLPGGLNFFLILKGTYFRCSVFPKRI